RTRDHGPSCHPVADSAACRILGMHALQRLASTAGTVVPRAFSRRFPLGRLSLGSARSLRLDGLMNVLRGLSAVIARWRLRWITKRRLREMLRRDDIIRGESPRLAVPFAAGRLATSARRRRLTRARGM